MRLSKQILIMVSVISSICFIVKAEIGLNNSNSTFDGVYIVQGPTTIENYGPVVFAAIFDDGNYSGNLPVFWIWKAIFYDDQKESHDSIIDTIQSSDKEISWMLKSSEIPSYFRHSSDSLTCEIIVKVVDSSNDSFFFSIYAHNQPISISKNRFDIESQYKSSRNDLPNRFDFFELNGRKLDNYTSQNRKGFKLIVSVDINQRGARNESMVNHNIQQRQGVH